MAGWVIDRDIKYKRFLDLPSNKLADCGSGGRAVEFQGLLYLIKTDSQGYYVVYTWRGSAWSSSTLSLTPNSQYPNRYPLLIVFEEELHMMAAYDHYAYDGSSWRSVSTPPIYINPLGTAEITVGNIPYSVGSGRYRSNSAIIIVNRFTETNQCEVIIYQNRALPPSYTPSYSWRYFESDLPGTSQLSLQLSKGYLVTVIRGTTNYIFLICADVDAQTICIYDFIQNVEPDSWHSLVQYYGSGNIPRLGTWTSLYDALFVPSGLYSSNSAKLCLFFSKDSGNVCFSNTHSPEEYYLPAYWSQDSVIQPGIVGSDLLIFDDKLNTLGGPVSDTELRLQHSILVDGYFDPIKNVWIRPSTIFDQNSFKRVIGGWIGGSDGKAKEILSPKFTNDCTKLDSPAPGSRYAWINQEAVVLYENKIHLISAKQGLSDPYDEHIPTSLYSYDNASDVWTLVSDHVPVEKVTTNDEKESYFFKAINFNGEIHIIYGLKGLTASVPKTIIKHAKYSGGDTWTVIDSINVDKYPEEYIYTVVDLVIFKNKLHMILNSGVTSGISFLHLVWNGSDHWDRINDIYSGSSYIAGFGEQSKIVSFDNTLYLINQLNGSDFEAPRRGVFVYDDQTLTWTRLCDLPFEGTNNLWIGYPIVYDNKLYLFSITGVDFAYFRLNDAKTAFIRDEGDNLPIAVYGDIIVQNGRIHYIGLGGTLSEYVNDHYQQSDFNFLPPST